MVDTVTPNMNFTILTVGGDGGTWGGIVNNNNTTPLDGILGATTAVAMTSSNVTLTLAQWQSAAFKITGVLTANLNLILPLSPNSVGSATAVGGKFIVDNETTGAHTITVLTAATGSTGVTIGQGGRTNLYSDTVNVWYDNDAAAGKLTTTNGTNPNGSFAGTAATVNSNASVAWDGTNLWVCTTTGNAASAVWTQITGQVVPPQGYLTMGTALVPIIGGDVIASPNVNYQPIGNTCPIFTGAVFSQVPFASSQVTATAGAQSANGLYDVFAFLNAGVFTLAFGPSWLAGSTPGNQTAGSCARGLGTGSTQLTRQNGIWVNNFALTTANNGATTYNIPQFQGTYLGTVYIDATAGQISCHRSWGSSRKFGVWNAYNRVPIVLQGGDSTASWTYNSATVRESNGSTTNVLTVLCGLPEEMISTSFGQVVNASGAEFKIGVGWNSTTSSSGSVPHVNGLAGQTFAWQMAQYDAAPAIGINNVISLESLISGGSTTFFGTQANMNLRAQWRG